MTIEAPPATATATAPAPSVVIQEGIETGEFTRSVTWSKTPDEAWFAEVYDRNGNLVAVEVAFDAYDTLVVLSEHLLPPEVDKPDSLSQRFGIDGREPLTGVVDLPLLELAHVQVERRLDDVLSLTGLGGCGRLSEIS